MNDKSLKVLEWQNILDALSSFALTYKGKNCCANLALYSDVSRIKREQTLTSEAKWLLDRVLYPPFEDVYDIDESIKLLKTNVPLNEQELFEVAKTIKASRLLKSFISKNSEEETNLKDFAQKLFSDRELEDDILSKFSSSGEIKDDATQELKSLNASLKDQSHNLKKKLGELLRRYDSYLQEQVYTQRDNRYVVPVKIEQKAHVKGIIHDVSASGMTVFIEPKDIVPLSNSIRETQIRIDAVIKQILEELSKKVAKYAPEIEKGLLILANIDCIFAKAKYSVELKAVEPELNSEKYLSIKKAKHPILMRLIDEVVSNDMRIGKDFDTLIITGSNTGGKTITLKTMGLFVLMTRAGLHLPCVEASIYPFEKIFADIGDEQSVAHSLSTFSGHINNLKEMLERTDDKTFILLDEIGVGTDPAEGSALAQSVLEFLSKSGARTVITTHYGELKALAFSEERFENASVEFDAKSLLPTYKLNIGIPGQSNALEIARNLGIDRNLIARARDLHLNIKDPTRATLEGLQRIQQELSANNKIAEQEKLQAQAYKQEYQQKLFKIKDEKKKALDAYKRKFDADLKVARDEIKDTMREIYQQKSEKLTRRAANKINKIEKQVRDGFYESAQELSPDFDVLDWSRVKPGDAVLLKDLKQSAVLVELPDKNDNVKVQIGLMKTSVKKDKIAKAKKMAAKPVQAKTPKLRRDFVSHDLNLRGVRVEDALDRLEKYLDEAALGGLSTVCIIHGHGTGVLKQAVRSYLSTSPYIKSSRAGQDGEGGDGVSIVELK